jgi:hypothetical protein
LIAGVPPCSRGVRCVASPLPLLLPSSTQSTLIDLDGEITQQDKTAMGDVELPIPGDAMPVPEPQ